MFKRYAPEPRRQWYDDALERERGRGQLCALRAEEWWKRVVIFWCKYKIIPLNVSNNQNVI